MATNGPGGYFAAGEPTMTDTHSDEIDLSEFELFDPDIQQCPHAYYAAMRERDPVYVTDAFGVPVFLVTRHDHVLEVLHDTTTYSSRFGGTSGPSGSELNQRITALYEELDGYDRVDTMLTTDPPAQTRYRRLVNKAFTPRAVAPLESSIRELANSLIDGIIDKRQCEFVADFAVPLPVTVIATALGVPADRLDDFKRWSDDAIAGIGSAISDDERIAAERGVIEFQHYFADQIAHREREPSDDLLTTLFEARIESGPEADGEPDHPLDMAEMLSIIQQILVAGNETTTKLLTEAMRLLTENPAEWERLREDPSRAGAIVEEVLRLSTPTQGMWRVVTADTELGGTPIPARSTVVVMFASANRSAEVFATPDDFNPGRDNLSNHVAFGKGAHFCLGASLARLEARVVLEELSRRIRSLRLPDTNDFRYHPSFMLRGLIRLDLEFTPV
jgi:cytochrome P450